MDKVKSDYGKARDASWKVISKYNITSLPVDVFDLARKMGIKVLPYSNSRLLMRLLGVYRLRKKNDGLYMRFIKRRYIFYDDSVKSQGRLRFTIAHELGHDVLGHTGRGAVMIPRCAERNREGVFGGYETEANIFASRLLAPSGVLHSMNITSAEDISQLCGISHEAATYRAERLATLNKRNMYNVSELERDAMERFKNFIESNK
ncbi:MAG: ImmA/IrrE family metallo-endopeptidase [Eubacteriales bacterium]|nr:ImmA/IrrE family metallo-endopeptidase [Eubacteriales bacterium]